MDDLEYSIQLQILIVFKTAAEKNHLNFFKSRGLNQQTMENLKALPTSALMQLAHYSPFELHCPEALLNTRMQSGIRKDKEKHLVRKAIQLGASRQCLQTFVVLNSKEYQRIREEVGYAPKRDKPMRLDDDLLVAISITHNNIKKQEHKLDEKFSALEILIKLSESHDIEINQLFNYYYKENIDLFDEERSFRK